MDTNGTQIAPPLQSNNNTRDPTLLSTHETKALDLMTSQLHSGDSNAHAPSPVYMPSQT